MAVFHKDASEKGTLAKKRLMVLFVAVMVMVSACGDDDDENADEPLGPGPFAVADLTITYDHPDTGTVVYQIVCLGDTATITGDITGVDASSACMSLSDSDVQRRLVEGVPSDQICAEVYGGPETAAIVGTVEEQAVDTGVDRANACGISDWDGVLQPLLPEPRPFS